MISSNIGKGGSSSNPTLHVDQDVDMAKFDENQHRLQKLEELVAQWSAMTFEDSDFDRYSLGFQ